MLMQLVQILELFWPRQKTMELKIKNDGHYCIFKTYKRLYEVAYWPRIWTFVKNFIKHWLFAESETVSSLKADKQKPADKI